MYCNVSLKLFCRSSAKNNTIWKKRCAYNLIYTICLKLKICKFFQKPCPEEASSFLSKIFYSWFDPLAWKGFRNPLENSDLWNMKPEDSALEIVPQFDKHWRKSLAKCNKLVTEICYFFTNISIFSTYFL